MTEPSGRVLALEHPVRTPRLVLRPIDPVADVDAVHAYASREDVCRFIPWMPRTREEVATWLPRRTTTTLRQEGAGATLAITAQDSGVLVGEVIFIWASAEHRTGEIGYVVHPDHAGQGYASEAAGALLAMAFERLGMHRVVARIDARNPASGAVLRRIGMRQEAVLLENEWFKGGWTTEVDFAILEREWQAQRDRAASSAPGR